MDKKINIYDYAWIFTLLVAIGGLWIPKLGLLVVLIMLSLSIMSFFNGKYWCGNFCPHGSFFDKFIFPISRKKNIPKFLQSKLFQLSFFVFFIYNFSNKMIHAFTFWNTYEFLDKLGFVFVSTYLSVLIIGSILGIVISRRTWCKFCRMGTMQEASLKLGDKLKVNRNTNKLITISDKDKCKECGLCSKKCPIMLEPHKNFDQDNKFNDPRCMKCGICANSCPLKILELK